MATPYTRENTGKQPGRETTEAEAVLEQVIDSHPDRAHHDELGRTEEPTAPDGQPDEAPPSPREQPATAIDIQKVDE